MKFKLREFFNELLLYSGQYALFYILMNFSKSGLGYFSYTAHTVLILALILQTLILYRYGQRTAVRILGSLICPFIYTLFEIRELSDFILNMGHFFFWGFSLFVGILNALKAKSHQKLRFVFEFVTVFMNVVTFIFIYIYFDIALSQAGNNLNQINEYNGSLSIMNMASQFVAFYDDVAHIYITLGGILLGISLGLSQVRVIQLKDKINDLFGKYMDRSVRDILVENNGIYKEKRELCVLFCDIRNFTTISESLESSIIVESLNRYFTMWETIATQYNGVINKYIGDAVMIIFGLNDSDNQENNAVQCALKVLESLNDMNNSLSENKLAQFNRIGIGIHRGDLVLGNVGGENRKEFTVIGDVVNTASRIESHTKLIESDLLISKEVYIHLNEELKAKFQGIESAVLKGKESAVELYEAVGTKV